MGFYLVAYDISGIQSYIFKTRKIKEISGASLIVRNYLDEAIKNYCETNKNFKLVNNWMSVEKYEFKTKKDFLAYLDKQTSNYIEYAFEGGGNLFLFFKGEENNLKNFNKEIQIDFLKNTGGLSLAFSYVSLDDNKELFNDYRKAVLDKLQSVKAKMPRNNEMSVNPLMKLDPIYGTPIINEANVNSDVSYEAYPKLKYLCNYNNKNNNNVEKIDDLIDEDNKAKNTDKNMIAVIHIDGNDMAAMITNYIKNVENNCFLDSLKISRELSKKIDYVFKDKVNEVIDKNYNVKMILNSGDDITFVSNALNALEITKAIVDAIKEESLFPETVESKNKDVLKNDNKFSACAGICYCHPHFPFSRAYEIAEELCSNAKVKAKSNRVKTNLNGYERPTSWFDFEIIQTGILKSIDEIRNEKPYLYLRPYSYDSNIEDIHSYESLINIIEKFRESNEDDISRGNAKEIRNTYELTKIDVAILFERLKSRKALEKLDYKPFIGDYAKYYDATSLYDLYNPSSKGDVK